MPKLTVSQEVVGDVVVMHLVGRITLGEEAATLREAVRSALTSDHHKLVLDLSGVGYVDSAGIGELVLAYTTATSAGSTLLLAGLTKRVSDLLRITKLETVFTIFPTAADAVAELRAQSTV